VAEVFAELDGCTDSVAEALTGCSTVEITADSRSRIDELRRRAIVPEPRAASTSRRPGGGQTSDGGFAGMIASRSVEIVSGAGTGPPGGPLLPAFLGERPDFDSYVVKRFILRVMAELRERNRLLGGHEARPELDMPQGPDDLARRADLEEAGGGSGKAGLLLMRPWKDCGPADFLVMLMRRPVGAGILAESARGYRYIVAAGRPWDSDLPEGAGMVMVTGGIYDAAAAAAIRLTGL
jgi:hypothetical protein